MKNNNLFTEIKKITDGMNNLTWYESTICFIYERVLSIYFGMNDFLSKNKMEKK